MTSDGKDVPINSVIEGMEVSLSSKAPTNEMDSHLLQYLSQRKGNKKVMSPNISEHRFLLQRVCFLEIQRQYDKNKKIA